ncbi:hypothetical protein TWF679_006209 [Orbilia oligospora]|uniref:Uncharacterized protein n=1 Tax=Orbilia oligospora TaxID=2813651 RepID=A0A8H8UP87_ORBOL|nr:hypothetical protein TWF679_006209 [Orbilia oligospora]
MVVYSDHPELALKLYIRYLIPKITKVAYDYAYNDLVSHPPARLQAIIKSNPIPRNTEQFLEFLDTFTDEFDLQRVDPAAALANSTPLQLPSTPDTPFGRNKSYFHQITTPAAPYFQKTKSSSPSPLFCSLNSSKQSTPGAQENRRHLLPAAIVLLLEKQIEQAVIIQRLVFESQDILWWTPLLLEEDSLYVNVHLNSFDFGNFKNTSRPNSERGGRPLSPFHAPTIKALTPSPSHPRPDKISPLTTPNTQPLENTNIKYQPPTYLLPKSVHSKSSVSEPYIQKNNFDFSEYHHFFSLTTESSTSTISEITEGVNPGSRDPGAGPGNTNPGGTSPSGTNPGGTGPNNANPSNAGSGGAGPGSAGPSGEGPPGSPNSPGGPGSSSGSTPPPFNWNLFIQTFAQGQLNIQILLQVQAAANNNQ